LPIFVLLIFILCPLANDFATLLYLSFIHSFIL
jgi:hypothetical protein